jgi:hypothetical protein
MGGSKNAKKPNEKKGFFIVYQGPKFKKWVVQKMETLKWKP